MIRKIIPPAVALALAACGPSAEPTQPVQRLMIEQVQPKAQLYWDSVQFVSDEQGDRDIAPRNDAEWERVRKAAADLSSIGELLQSPAYLKDRNEDWKQFAQALVEVSKKAENAAADQDPDSVLEIGGILYNVCSACHQSYLPKESAETAGTAGK